MLERRQQPCDDLAAERVGELILHTWARPRPERPVSAASKSGRHKAAPRCAITYPRAFLGPTTPARNRKPSDARDDHGPP